MSGRESTEKRFDLILFGATGFTGRQAYKYLALNEQGELRWAIAGRNRKKLLDVANLLPSQSARPQIVEADYSDPQSMDSLASNAKAIVNLAGPYAEFGEHLIKACVEHKTDYVDIGGETFFIAQMIEKYHRKALKRGVKIIPVCGYESLPFDLLTLLAARYAKHRFSENLVHAKIITDFTRSGPIRDNRISGGSLGTMKNIMAGDTVNAYSNPACLLPAETARGEWQSLNRVSYRARYDEDAGELLAPLYPAPFLNVPVVLRSAYLLSGSDTAYALPFHYEDAMKVGFFANSAEEIPARAKQIARQYRFTSLLMRLPRLLRQPLKRRLDKIDLKPGDGPSEAALESVDYKLQLFGKTSTGRPVHGTLTADGHPGYLSTAWIAAEAGLALALDRENLPQTSGVLTPATGLGLEVTARLRRAGVLFWIEDGDQTFSSEDLIDRPRMGDR